MAETTDSHKSLRKCGNWRPHALLVGTVQRQLFILENNSAIPQKIKQLAGDSAVFPPQMSSGIKNTCAHKSSHTNVHSSIIHRSQMAEVTIQELVNGQMKCNINQEYDPLMKRSEILAHAAGCQVKEAGHQTPRSACFFKRGVGLRS